MIQYIVIFNLQMNVYDDFFKSISALTNTSKDIKEQTELFLKTFSLDSFFSFLDSLANFVNTI